MGLNYLYNCDCVFCEKYRKENEMGDGGNSVSSTSGILAPPITEQAVKDAAKECADAAKVLKKLFPKVFEDDNIVVPDADGLKFGIYRLEVRTAGNWAKKGLYLTTQLKWEIVTDDKGLSVLIARRK